MSVQESKQVADSGIEIGRVGNVTVIRLVGEHDLNSAPRVRAAIKRHAPQDVKGVVVDLNQLDFIDSAIIHTLCLADQEFTARGGRLVLHYDAGSVADRVISLALGDALLTGDTLEEAITFAGQMV